MESHSGAHPPKVLPPLRLLDFSSKNPAKNLALDEALLELERNGEVLRIWECPSRFVVLGVSQILRSNVNESACERDRVPILRRCSAGGCVLQGPGCLNFSLVLHHKERPEIRTIRDSYCDILGKLAEALRKRGIQASHKGVSDLAVGGKKFSGNAQSRRKNAILHHGTLLYKLDTDRMERYLRDPVDRPHYRGDRSHRTFVTSIPLGRDALKEALIEAFGANTESDQPRTEELHRAEELVTEKYALSSWTHRR